MNHVRFQKSANLPGIECFYFIQASQISRDPVPGLDMVKLNGEEGYAPLIVRALPLIPGAVWYQATVSKHTLHYNGSGKLTRSGMLYEHALSGSVAKVTPEVASVLAQFHQQRCVVIYQDRNGYLRLIGSRDYGLLFSFEEDTGTQPGDRNQVSFQFTGNSRYPAFFYDGQLIDQLAGLQETDLGDVTVPTAARVLADGITLRIIA